jgi:hypothetical protein
MYVLALLAFAEQLAQEEAAASKPEQSTGGDDQEAQND